ncbi:hypothetical protein R0K18_25800, partial [Pantoea sp. SIMBA_133]
AERRKLVPPERTGAMQLVEIVERREERFIHPDIAPDDLVETVGAERPFASLSDDALLDVGVPREWIEPVRETEITRVDDLFDSLPDEAAEALLDYATGGKLEDHIA